MGQIKTPEQVLLFVGTLYSEADAFHRAKEILKRNFEDILFISASLPWDYSIYYKDELGWPLFRQFIFFKNLIDPGSLADTKIRTNEIEATLSKEGKRSINIDPGYLTLSKIVLASTKNYSHRIYLGKGIYGEVTLIYKGSTYSSHLYTYRDYQDEAYIDIFMKAREILKSLLSKNSLTIQRP